MPKKILGFVLLFCFIFAAPVSCAGEADKQSQVSPDGQETQKEYPSEKGDPEFADDLPDLNFKGKEFKFLVEAEPAFRHLYDVNVETENGDIVIDTIYRRNRTVEELLGVSIKDAKDQNAARKIENSVAAGETEYSGVWLKVDNFFPTSLSGSFLNLHNVPYLDFEKKYWDQNAVSDMTISGKLYGMTGDITTATHMFTNLLLYNKSIAADYGLPNLYNIVREGKWTFDVFDEITKNIYSDLNGNGKADKDDFFAVDINPAAYEAFFSSAGEKWIEKNAEGLIVFSDLTEKKIAVLKKIEEMFTNQKHVWCSYDHPFKDSRAIFYDIDIGSMCDMRDSDVDFGILPVPKYSEGQERYYVYAYPFFPFLSVPNTMAGEELEMAGAVLEAIASESYRTLTPAFYSIALENKFTRDEESYEMLEIIMRSRIYDLLYWGPWDGFRNWGSGLVSAMQKGDGSYVSTYEKNIDRSKTKIDEIVAVYADLDG